MASIGMPSNNNSDDHSGKERDDMEEEKLVKVSDLFNDSDNCINKYFEKAVLKKIKNILPLSTTGS